MNKGQWSKQVGGNESARRAGGRRRHNAAKTRRMWERRFAILRMMRSTSGDLQHGGQRLLAERFGVNKSVISRDVAWARKHAIFESGFTLRCSYRRRTVSLTWVNTEVENILRDSRNVLRQARKWLKEAERKGAAR